jgi:hypothetical protein
MSHEHALRTQRIIGWNFFSWRKKKFKKMFIKRAAIFLSLSFSFFILSLTFSGLKISNNFFFFFFFSNFGSLSSLYSAVSRLLSYCLWSQISSICLSSFYCLILIFIGSGIWNDFYWSQNLKQFLLVTEFETIFIGYGIWNNFFF